MRSFRFIAWLALVALTPLGIAETRGEEGETLWPRLCVHPASAGSCAVRYGVRHGARGADSAPNSSR